MNFKFFNKIKQKKDIFLESQKNFLRTKIDFKPVNFPILLSLLPFFLGVSQFISKKYSFDKNNIFFEQNLPAISSPTQTLHWDTFIYLIKNKNLGNNIKEAKIVFSENEIIIETKNSKELPFRTPKNLKGYKTSIDSFKNTIQPHYHNFKLEEKNQNAVLQAYQNIDEMPTKLEGNPTIKEIVTSLELTPNLSVGPLQQTVSTPKNKKILFSKFIFNSQQLIGYKLPTEIRSTENNFKSEFILDKHYQNLLEQQDFLNSEIKKFFLNNNVLPLLTKKFDISNSTPVELIKKQDLTQTIDVISEMDKILIPGPLTLTRLMSGYYYPDMSFKEIFSFVLQKDFRKTAHLKILLPPTYLSPQNSHFTSIKSPAYLISSNKLLLEEPNQNKTFYEGPSISLNEASGFDWQVNSPTLQFWIESFLGVTNPVKENFKNFFGLLESPDYVKPISIQDTNNNNYIFKNLILFKTGIVTNPLNSYFPFTRSFFVPEVTFNELQNYLLNDAELTDFNSIQYNTIALPIVETRLLKDQKPEMKFGYNNFSDFEFMGKINSIFGLSQNLDHQNLQISNPSLVSTNFNLTKYKKVQSLFDQTSTLFFSDIWESLTLNSWLITAQLGFAFLGFIILKALADNYGRELLVYLLDLVAVLGFVDDDIKQEIEILMGQREKGFRIIEKVNKNFQNIGGIQNLLPEIVEIVWFLRNSGREFSLSKTLPRGVLLTGPPGTGKTLLVQAIAGEAQVPVLALSGSSLLEPGESGALKLEILFDEARKSAPCIVFIDEMDTLAEKRVQVLQNPMGADEILESLSNQEAVLPPSSELNFISSKSKTNEELTQEIFAQQDMHKEKLRILMQFLVELDGIKGRDGVIVIGATNRPEMLDPAVLRPGRFDRVLDLGLPGPEKRCEILKLYGQNLGFDKTISLNYLINRTAGYSAADLAGIMNQSTLNAILKNTQHTIQTIEYGIDRITTIGVEHVEKEKNKKFLTSQVAYYQAGKVLLSYLLEHHPPTLVTHLWPRRANARALQINENLQKYLFRFARRIELEHRIIGCYAGKAAEILFLQDKFSNVDLSDLGIEEAQFAQNLVRYMIEKWFFYGKTHITKANSQILTNLNEKEYRENLEKISFFESSLEPFELSLIETGEQFGGELLQEEDWLTAQQAQIYFPAASWQYQISNQFELATRTFSDWYRLYLPDPLQKEHNLEWIPPDEFYHGNILNEKLTPSINWNELSQIQIDYEAHSLMLQSFNKALFLLDQHREILDKLVYELLSAEILRESEITSILKSFNLNFTTLEVENQLFDKFENNTRPTVLSTSWGTNSRRKTSRSINF